MRLVRALFLAAATLTLVPPVVTASDKPLPSGKRNGIVALAPAGGASLTIVPIRVIGSAKAPKIDLIGTASLGGDISIGASVVKLARPRGAYVAVISSVSGASLSSETGSAPVRFRIRAPRDARLTAIAAQRAAVLSFRRDGARFLPTPGGSPASFCAALTDADGPTAAGDSLVETLASSRFSSRSLVRGSSASISNAKALLVDSFSAADLACGNGSPSVSDVASFVKKNITTDFEYRGCGAPIPQTDGSVQVSCVIQIEQAPFQKVPTCPDVDGEGSCQPGVGGGSELYKAFAHLPDGATILGSDVKDLETGSFPAADIFPGQTWELYQERSGKNTLDVVISVTDRNPFGVIHPTEQPHTLRYTLTYRE